jgi:hypothetical protein
MPPLKYLHLSHQFTTMDDYLTTALVEAVVSSYLISVQPGESRWPNRSSHP